MFGVFYLGGKMVAADLDDFGANRSTYTANLERYYVQIDGFVERLRIATPPETADDSSDTASEDPTALPVTSPSAPTTPPSKNIADLGTEIRRWLGNADLGRLLGQGTMTFFGFVGDTLVVLVFMFFMLVELDRLPLRIRKAYREKEAETILDVYHQINTSVQRYIALKVFISALTAGLSFVVMVVFGLHYAVTFTILVFLFNFIPYLGSVIATLAPMLIALVQFDDPWQALWIGLSLIGVQQVIGNVIEPKVQGQGLQLSPVMILLSLAFWGWLWGIVGMILAVPVTAVVRLILEHFDGTRHIAVMMSDATE